MQAAARHCSGSVTVGEQGEKNKMNTTTGTRIMLAALLSVAAGGAQAQSTHTDGDRPVQLGTPSVNASGIEDDSYGQYSEDDRFAARFDDSALQRIQPTRGLRRRMLEREAADTLHLPQINSNGQVCPPLAYPMAWGGCGNWDLHPGLNMSVGASVFAQFGRGAHGGAGFGQNISLMYALPVNDHLSVAVGGYLNNVYWAHNSYRDAGLTAVVGYKFNDRWEAYIYGQKSLTNNYGGGLYGTAPYTLYDMRAIGDRIGAAVKYNVNSTMSIQVSFENVWMPSRKQMPAGPGLGDVPNSNARQPRF